MAEIIQQQDSRRIFIDPLIELAEKDPRVILIVGDVGFSFIEPFRARFSNQFINVGTLEQTMMGFAVGMAHMGWKPYVYTMKNFILLRPLEQVRNDICYGNVNVKLFGVAGSAAYKFLGYSHNLADGEEAAILGTLPNINSYFPETEEEATKFIHNEYVRNGPAYFAI